jgi:superfamily II DNA or RNA helicase
MKWNFNLSYSSYSMYKQSQLQFFYEKIIKAKPDTDTYKVYGDLGNIIHTFAEKYIVDKNIIPEFLFEELWSKYDIVNQKTLYNSVINKQQWLNYIKLVKLFIDNYLFDVNIICEKELSFRFSDGLLVKGFIDVFVTTPSGEYIFYDWKTNSSHDYNLHRLQRLFYSWLCFKVYKKIPRCVWFYTKGGKPYEDTFSLVDLYTFDKEVENFKKEILAKGTDINQYDLGDWDTPFNTHKKKCLKVFNDRNNNKKIIITIRNNLLCFGECLSNNVKGLLSEKFSYLVDGYNWSELYKKRLWDGKKRFFKNNTLPLGFKSMVEEFFRDYNEHFKTSYELLFVDERLSLPVYETVFKSSDKTLRPYQEDCVKKVLDKKIGLVAIGTGGGKSLIAAEILKRINKRGLVVVNRVELLEQIANDLEEHLGLEVGRMVEGVLVVDKQFCVVSIQTIISILKRGDESTKLLRDYLWNIGVCIYDEAQNVTNINSYGFLKGTLLNCEYFVGLSGSPWREYRPETMELTAVVGEVIFSKTTKELIDEGFLVPCVCKFLRVENISINKDYHEEYDELVVNNVERNNMVKSVCERLFDKKILIITKRVNHARFLSDMISNSYLITGGTKKDVRCDDFKSFKEGVGGVLVGTHQIFSTGINLPDLDCLINVTGGKSDIVTIQSIGRIMRKTVGKSVAYYYDFFDVGSKYLYVASQNRVSILRSFGHEVEVVKPKSI